MWRRSWKRSGGRPAASRAAMKRRRSAEGSRRSPATLGEDVVVAAREVRAAREAVERAECLVAERDVSGATALGRALDVAGERALDDEHSLGPADVAPAQGDELAAAKAGVSGDAEQLAELGVLLRAEHGASSVRSSCGPRHAPDSAVRASASTCSTVKTSSRAGGASRRLAAAAAGFAVSRQRAACSGRRPKLKIAAQDLAVLVDAARADALACVRDSSALDLCCRDLGDRHIAERGHDPPDRHAAAAAVRRARLGEHRAVVAQRRRLGAEDELDVLEPRVRERAERRAAGGRLTRRRLGCPRSGRGALGLDRLDELDDAPAGLVLGQVPRRRSAARGRQPRRRRGRATRARRADDAPASRPRCAT